MLVKLQNLGTAQRVIHDINKVPRVLHVGQALDLDLHPDQARRYVAEAARPKARLRCKLHEPLPPPQPKTVKVRNMHLPVQEPRSLSEAARDGMGMRARAHADEPYQQGDEIPPEAPNDDSGTVKTAEEEPAQRQGAIEHNAAQQQQEESGELKQPGEGDQQEPETATQLLAAINAQLYDEQTVLRLANKILVNKLPRRPRPAQIMAAVQEQVEAENRSTA